MWRYLFFAVSVIGAATQLPTLLQGHLDEGQVGQNDPPAQLARAEIAEESRNPLAGRVARVEADRRGHFIARARLNGRSMDVLVDTGATRVAMNESTARRIGIRLKPQDFKYRVRTANGVTSAAAATVDEIRIGRIVVRDVPASISRDEALSVVLLGMSFLQKLKKYQVESGTLVLSQ